jgi:PPOX class probable F420-dependent enzyme
MRFHVFYTLARNEQGSDYERVEEMMNLDLQNERHAHIDRRLGAEEIIWLSSVRPDGRPHLVPVWYLWDDGTILIFSQPGAQKVRNLSHDSRVALALDSADEGEDIVIVEGEAELLPAGTVDSTLPAYVEKYGRLMESINTSPEKMAADYSQAIRVRPARFLPA